MDKNTIIGFILIGAVLFGFTWLNQPSAEQIAANRKYQDSIATVLRVQQEMAQQTLVAEKQAVAVIDSLATSDSLIALQQRNLYGAFAPCASGTADTIQLNNDLVSIQLSTHGGTITQVTLNNYLSYDSLPVNLFSEKESSFGFIFKTGGRVIDTRELYFRPIATGNSVTMRLDIAPEKYFELCYTLSPESYIVEVQIRQKGMEQVLPSNTANLDLFWNQRMRRQEKGRTFEERNSGLFYKFVGDEVENLSESKDDNKSVGTGLKWIGYKNQFFSSVLVAHEKFEGATLSSTLDKNTNYLKNFNSETSIAYTPADGTINAFSFYFVPNLYPLLSSYDNGRDANDELSLDRLIPLGFSFLRWLNTLIIIPIFTFLGKFISNYGIIILLLTLIIKTLLLPLTYKSYMSTAKMRVLRPQIEEINAKHPGADKAMERQKETMALYSKVGINPMSGCLPMLLQMPILLAMFSFFPSSIELRGESFLWAKDLSSYDSIYSWDTYIPLITPYFGNHISLFCLLMTITNIVYTKINMDNNAGQAQMPGMKLMMYIMPLMFLFIFNNYASGLSYYYFISTLITILQTYAFRKFIDEDKVLAKLHAAKNKPRKKTGFMARLEEAQRRQQQILREQQKKGKR